MCYDLTVHSASRLALKSLGIPLPSITSILGTIKRMSHTVRAAYGDSNLTYGRGTILDRFIQFMMELCQGNGCAPQLWSIISSIVFSTHQTKGFGIYFVNSFTAEISQLAGFSYVDNCDMIQSDEDLKSTHFQMQLEISELEDLIRTT